MFDETIAAIATPLGQGGLAIIRISGDKALAIADSLFAPGGKSKSQLAKAKSHTLHYGHIARRGGAAGPAGRVHQARLFARTH